MTMKSVSAYDVEVVEENQLHKRFRKTHIPTFGNHVYSSHPENKNYIYRAAPAFNSMKSSSSHSVDSCLENVTSKEKGQEESMLNLSVASNITDSFTQTSKTILQLARLETESLSPDSLMQSPRNPKLLNKENHFNVKQLETKLEQCSIDPETTSSCFTLTGSFSEESNTTMIYERKNNLIQYFDGDEHCKNNHSEDIFVYPNKSLTETFLKKKKYDDKLTCNCRSTFLQQTSPLRNLSEKSPESDESGFKSSSCIEPCSPNFTDFKVPNQISRFTVKSIKNQQSADSAQSVKCYWPPANSKNYIRLNKSSNSEQTSPKNGNISTVKQSLRSSSCSKRNNSSTSSSFMSPTISSERRNQSHKVQNIKGLISPTRRGKSVSPCRSPSRLSRIPRTIKKSDKIPYIDQSQSTITVNQYEPSKGKIPIRQNISYRAKSPASLFASLEDRSKFDEDLFKIDLQSLHVPFSEDTVSEIVQPSRSSSITSTENSLILAMNRVKNTDWSEALKGLAEIIDLCRMIDHDIIFPHMTAVNQRLLELLRSPRSHVCRTACQAAGHLFECMKDTRRPEFDDIVENLLCKTADANKFIRNDANLSLDCMVTHIPIYHAVRSLCLKGPSHKNALVRTATIRLIVCAVVIAGPCAVLSLATHEYTRKRIILHLIKFLADKNLETRKYGERLYKILSKEALFESCLKKYMEKDEITTMKTLLKNKDHRR